MPAGYRAATDGVKDTEHQRAARVAGARAFGRLRRIVDGCS
jgi:hypothetical protein